MLVVIKTEGYRNSRLDSIDYSVTFQTTLPIDSKALVTELKYSGTFIALFLITNYDIIGQSQSVPFVEVEAKIVDWKVTCGRTKYDAAYVLDLWSKSGLSCDISFDTPVAVSLPGLHKEFYGKEAIQFLTAYRHIANAKG